MTGRNTPSPDSEPHLLHLLQDAGVEEDPALFEAVKDIAELAERAAPEPSAELAQLMANGGKATGGRRTKGRITFIGGALAVSMGVGMSGVAAGPADRHVEADGSVGSVTRSWARDHVDRLDPVAGPSVVAPAPSDAGGPSISEDAIPGPPVSDGEAPGGSEFGAGLPLALPAAHRGAAPSGSTGATAPARAAGATPPSLHPTPGSIGSVPGAAAPNTVDAPATDQRASDLRTFRQQGAAATSDPRRSTPRGGPDTSARGAGESGWTAAPGGAGLPDPGVDAGDAGDAGDVSRYVEEPARFATLGWVNEDRVRIVARGRATEQPDEPVSDPGPAPGWLRAPGAAPDNVVLLSEPTSDDGRWLALFVPDGADLTREPAPDPSGDAVPSLDAAPVIPDDVPADAVPSPAAVPEVPREGLPKVATGLESVPAAPNDGLGGVVPATEEPAGEPAQSSPGADAELERSDAPEGEPAGALPEPEFDEDSSAG